MQNPNTGEYIGILNSPKSDKHIDEDDEDVLLQYRVIADLEYRQKVTVFGYIRQQKSTVLFPVDIIKLVITFYKSQDDWDRLLSHHSIEVDDDYIATAKTGLWTIGFGKDKVNAGRVKEWVLKLFRIDSAIIGVVSSNQIHLDCNSGDYTLGSHALKGYGLCGSNGMCYEPSQFGEKECAKIGCIHNKDIVLMRLDLSQEGNTGTLSFRIQDGEYIEATDKVPNDKEWTLAVAFYGRGKVQLLK